MNLQRTEFFQVTVLYLVDRAGSFILVHMAIDGDVDLVLLPELLQLISRLRLCEGTLRAIKGPR